MSDELKKLRDEIDSLDDQIIQLLNQRAEAAVNIGRIKASHGNALYVPSREKEVMERLISQNKGPLSHASIWRIFSAVMASSLALEHHEHVMTGGADEETLRHAIDFIEGGNAELNRYDSPAQLVEALVSADDAVAVVPGSWLDEVRAARAPVQWSGCWLVEKGADSGTRFHLFKKTKPGMGTGGPVSIYCLIDEAGKDAVLTSGWIESIPARSVDVAEIGNDTQSLVLKFRLESDDAKQISGLVGEIAQKCNFVWTV